MAENLSRLCDRYVRSSNVDYRDNWGVIGARGGHGSGGSRLTADPTDASSMDGVRRV